MEKLDSCLLEFEAVVVKKIPLCHTQQRDIITWPFTTDGEYTVKSGYQFLMNELHKADSGPSSNSKRTLACGLAFAGSQQSQKSSMEGMPQLLAHKDEPG